jgi:hypothetical protein
MVSKRQVARQDGRILRTLAQRSANEKLQAVRSRVEAVVTRARTIFSDPDFVDLLRLHDIKRIPATLELNTSTAQEIVAGEQFRDATLAFIFAWNFLYPLFAKPAVARYLDRCWPGFIMEMKDAFISSMMDGPFRQRVKVSRQSPPFRPSAKH